MPLAAGVDIAASGSRGIAARGCGAWARKRSSVSLVEKRMPGGTKQRQGRPSVTLGLRAVEGLEHRHRYGASGEKARLHSERVGGWQGI